MAKERLIDDEGEAPVKKARGARTQAQAKARGRAIVGTLLVGFVLVASAVIWRRGYGIQLSHDLSDLDRQRTQLEGERARLRSVIRDESSRSQLAPVAEQLGMRVPSDKQVRILQR